MVGRSGSPVLITVCVLVLLLPLSAFSQASLGELQPVLTDNASFTADDFGQLQQGETVVKVFPANDQREIGVCGIVKLNVLAKEFLDSYREIMVRRSNPAILEIGSFGATPTLDDLRALSLESRDVEDIRDCAVGRCAVKLSSKMIERFQKEVDWQAEDYQQQATNLFKLMLLEYVAEYLSRGDAALIEYVDQSHPVRVAEAQRALLAAAAYFPDQLIGTNSGHGLNPAQNIIVWSKMNLGLKPVITINQITIYTREANVGPQVLVIAKQIYANHYFDSSLALTTFLKTATGDSYLYYENRSRADGLGGLFGKMKRDIVEGRAVNALKGVLDHTRLNLTARAQTEPPPQTTNNGSWSWKRWRLSAAHLVLAVLLLTGFSMFLVLSSYGPKSTINR